jgi:lipid-A-disaccharide synthase
MKILVSAGEASGDLYASALVQALRQHLPAADFFGCTGPRMRAAGVRTIVDAANLNVVGLVEVLRHIPRIYGEFRKLHRAAAAERPNLAILTDAPDFHLRLARKLRAQGVPIVYFIAPQVWAWRQHRIRQLRPLNHLLCIFPFEETYFRERGVRATYIGHPLTRLVRPSLPRHEWLARHRIPSDIPLITLLPGSRPGEIARHLPILTATLPLILSRRPAHFVLATPPQRGARPASPFLTEPIRRSPIQHIEGETWDAIAHAAVCLAASGTVTIEAALLGTPLVAFYKVSPWTWWMGRHLVNVPFYSMVNLVAQREIIPELIQQACTPQALADAALHLLNDAGAATRMRDGLQQVAHQLASHQDPIAQGALIVLDILRKEGSNAIS